MSLMCPLCLIAAALALDNMRVRTPAAAAAGSWIGAAVCAVYAILLFLLSSEEKAYKKAAAFFIAAAVIFALALILPSETVLTKALLPAAGSILLIFGRHFECTGHSAVISDPDFKTSGFWLRLGSWYIIALAASALRSLLSPMEGKIPSLIVSAGVLLTTVACFAGFVMLLHSARLCRNFYGTLGR